MLIPAFIEEIENIYRLKIPFEDLYTSVFLIKTDNAYALVDCGTYDGDVSEWIVPALNGLGLSLQDVAYLVLTHSHGDHAGGKAKLSELNPKIETVTAERPLPINGLTVYGLKGHTRDCIGVLDLRSGTLVSGDGIQGLGVSRYPCLLESKDAYLQTLNKIKQDENVKNILFSHAYEPWKKDGVFGRENVNRILADCIYYSKERKE